MVRVTRSPWVLMLPAATSVLGGGGSSNPSGETREKLTPSLRPSTGPKVGCAPNTSVSGLVQPSLRVVMVLCSLLPVTQPALSARNTKTPRSLPPNSDGTKHGVLLRLTGCHVQV